jgi:hypothetical protein
MWERVVVDLTGGRIGLIGAVFRYEVLERLAKSAALHQVHLLAFGFGASELRLVLQGEAEAIGNVLKGLKVGTQKAAARWGLELRGKAHERRVLAEPQLLDTVAWVHRAPMEAGALCALASPWSSHRDVLGFRRAPFYDPTALSRLIDPVVLADHVEEFPEAWCTAPKEDLDFLLRISAAVLGRLPSDRRCFRLFVHLAKERGFGSHELAHALAVTVRRVRQLASEVEPDLPLALAALADRRLARVP